MSKLRDDVTGLLAETLVDGSVVAVGGFGLCGNPFGLIEVVQRLGVRDLTVVSNNMGLDGKGLGLLIDGGQVARVIASYVGENTLFAQRYLEGAIEVEFTPQGTLAERLRAGGAGIAGFYTRTGVGTVVAEGKPHAEFDGDLYVLERGIVADVALVRAHTADPEGNLTYRRTARNFNPLVAAAGRCTFVEAEVFRADFTDPDLVDTPGIFVDHVVEAPPEPKPIEQRVVRRRSSGEVVRLERGA
ncbi:CoA transferase subunit A [Nocardioides sp. AE5]|uniref:CoA transferase subunit A n=1 Tax=Nocardioides sp. AE5 TaxID=2962573 RepID=UPI0028823873|nr:CoA transferase subunit A [Nocardioides sp. AE5]MDT0202613.1 CoA transferase subunit A [Nocardioides sp. AE5]